VFGRRRTYNGKGVTIPSQIRYVNHYEAIVRERGIRPKRALQLARIEFLPEILDVDVKIQVASPKGDVLFDSASGESGLGPVVEGDFKVNAFVGKRKIFQAWMHTSYDPQWQAACSTNNDGSFTCNQGHRMRLIQALEEGPCSICAEILHPGDDVFECRECDEIVWRCPKCPAGEYEDANGSRLRAIIDSSKFILRARSGTSHRSSAKVVPATPRLSAPLKSRLSTSSLAPTLVTCPSGHRLVQAQPKPKARDWEGHWVCDGCRTHSWEQHLTRYACGRCNYNLCNHCYDCPSSVGDGAGAQSATVVWQQPGDAGFPSQAWVAFLKKADLDGPHKQSKKAKKAGCRSRAVTGTCSTAAEAGPKSMSGAASSSTATHSPRSPRPHGVGKGQSAAISKDVVNSLQEVRFYFTDVIDSHSMLPVDKEQTAGSPVGAYRSRKSRAGGHRRQSIMNYVMGSYWSDEGGEGDYDALADDTDNEVNLTIMCRGYLLRQLGGCCMKRRRLCELHTNGELHIDGSSFLVDSLVLNLAACDILQDPSSAGQEWIITSDATSTTVHLEAETDEDVEKWEEAFIDIQKALEKPPFHLPAPEGRTFVQRSFFHILVDDAVDPERITCIVAFQWDVRLLTLEDDCCLYMYSAASGYDEVFSNLSDHENSIQLVHTQLQGESYVVFQVPCLTGQDSWHTLAAEADTFEQLSSQVNALSRRESLAPFVAGLFA